MNFLPTARTTKMVRDGRAYYTIRWSPLHKADKYAIQKIVPAMAGLYELFYRDSRGARHLFHYGRAWLGGLRAVIREFTDPDLMRGRQDLREILQNHPCFYRFSVCESREDIEDILFFFDGHRRRQGEAPREASGRYREIRIKEERAR